jgi:hypothetical protein
VPLVCIGRAVADAVYETRARAGLNVGESALETKGRHRALVK